jgi:hypothetical protein
MPVESIVLSVRLRQLPPGSNKLIGDYAHPDWIESIALCVTPVEGAKMGRLPVVIGVMPGLVPASTPCGRAPVAECQRLSLAAIGAIFLDCFVRRDVDGPDEPGHDEVDVLLGSAQRRSLFDAYFREG